MKNTNDALGDVGFGELKGLSADHNCTPPRLPSYSKLVCKWRCPECKAHWWHDIEDQPWWGRERGWSKTSNGSWRWRRKEARRRIEEIKNASD